MKRKILVGDRVKYTKGSDKSKVYTVIGVGKGRYLVTHPTLLFPKSGMWLYPDEIIHLLQEREVK